MCRNRIIIFSITLFLVTVFSFFHIVSLPAQEDTSLPAYKNMQLPVEDRLEDLLSRMTLQEKINMVSGATAGEMPKNIADIQNADSPTTILTAAE